MDDSLLVRYEVKTFMLMHKCPSCNNAELRCIGLDVKNELLPWKHECPSCGHKLNLDKQYPVLAYERV